MKNSLRKQFLKFLICAAPMGLLFPVSVARSACTLWDVGGQFTITQSNGYAPALNLTQSKGAISGTARYEFGPPGFITNGTVAAGSNISGSQFHVVIQWDNNTRGAYNGTFTSAGYLSGTTCDELHPNSCASWSVKQRRFACLRP
jgi:hypothetical protein